MNPSRMLPLHLVQIHALGTFIAALANALLRSMRLPTTPRAAPLFRGRPRGLSFGRWNRPLGNPVAGRDRNVQRPARGRALHARHDADNGALACRLRCIGHVGKTSELAKGHVRGKQQRAHTRLRLAQRRFGRNPKALNRLAAIVGAKLLDRRRHQKEMGVKPLGLVLRRNPVANGTMRSAARRKFSPRTTSRNVTLPTASRAR